MTRFEEQFAAGLVKHVPRPHSCRLPGWWQRRRLNIGAGTIWRCECGQDWEWHENYAGQFWGCV